MKDNQAFTLIELLVVVLIIGILAAVALPQYKKAVWKSRNTQLKTAVSAVKAAQQNYYLANGTFTTSFEELSIDFPLTSGNGTTCGMASYADSAREGKDFEVQLYLGNVPLVAWWTSGPYKCSGFAYDKDGVMWCVERMTHFTEAEGSFCTKLEKAPLSNEATTLYSSGSGSTFGSRFYKLP